MLGKLFLLVRMAEGEAREFAASANEWLAVNAKRPALVAERLQRTPEHAIVLWRQAGGPATTLARPRPLPGCWTARFVRRAAPYLLEARLQPALGVATRRSAAEPAVELLVSASTPHGLLQLAALAAEHGLGVRGRCTHAATVALHAEDALGFADACAAVEAVLQDLLGDTHRRQTPGGAEWRLDASMVPRVNRGLSTPEVRRAMAGQRLVLPDADRAARGPV